jgi:folylpolyglutamate synthase/dihydropteroate synthase
LQKVVFTSNIVSNNLDSISSGDLTNICMGKINTKTQSALAQTWKELDCSHVEVLVTETVEDAIKICELVGGRCLVTGSLHLVGSAMTVLGADVE